MPTPETKTPTPIMDAVMLCGKFAMYRQGQELELKLQALQTTHDATVKELSEARKERDAANDKAKEEHELHLRTTALLDAANEAARRDGVESLRTELAEAKAEVERLMGDVFEKEKQAVLSNNEINKLADELESTRARLAALGVSGDLAGQAEEAALAQLLSERDSALATVENLRTALVETVELAKDWVSREHLERLQELIATIPAPKGTTP